MTSKTPSECGFCHSTGSVKKGYCVECHTYMPIENTRIKYKTQYVADPDPMQYREESEEIQEVIF